MPNTSEAWEAFLADCLGVVSRNLLPMEAMSDCAEVQNECREVAEVMKMWNSLFLLTT